MTGDSNHKSIVNRVIYGNYEFIFMGDADKETERMIVSKGYFKNDTKVKILKVGHHGSNTSSSELFLKTLKPEYCIISVGKNNKYGHPKLETMLTLQKYFKVIYRTDQDGDISFKTDGINLKINYEK